jgi:hypothetical protein
MKVHATIGLATLLSLMCGFIPSLRRLTWLAYRLLVGRPLTPCGWTLVRWCIIRRRWYWQVATSIGWSSLSVGSWVIGVKAHGHIYLLVKPDGVHMMFPCWRNCHEFLEFLHVKAHDMASMVGSSDVSVVRASLLKVSLLEHLSCYHWVVIMSGWC